MRHKIEKSLRKGISYFFTICLVRKTYKFKQERVFSQRSDATSESEDEHHTTHHQEEPDGVKTPQVCDG